jgi:hypothetical protein
MLNSFKDDPHFEGVQQLIQEYRQELDTLGNNSEIQAQESA